MLARSHNHICSRGDIYYRGFEWIRIWDPNIDGDIVGGAAKGDRQRADQVEE